MKKNVFLSVGFLAAAFFIVLFLGACASAPVTEQPFDKKVYSKGEKAYVVIATANNKDRKWFYINTTLIFKNEKGEQINLTTQNAKTRSFLIEPGTYTLSNFYVFGRRYFFGWRYGPFNSGYYDVSLSSMFTTQFKVAPGDAVYLGYVDVQVEVEQIATDYTVAQAILNTGEPFVIEIKGDVNVEDRSATDLEKFEKEVGKSIRVDLLKFQKLSDSYQSKTDNRLIIDKKRPAQNKETQTQQPASVPASQNPAGSAVTVPIEADRVQ